MQNIQKKIARLRVFTAGFGLSLALAIALVACKPVIDADNPSPAAELRPATQCGNAGQLRTELYGALAAQIDWRVSDLECAGMPRPNGQGARLRFSGAVGVDEQRIAIIIAIPDLQREKMGNELASNVTLIEEGSGRFFSTLDLGNCLTDITALDELDESGDRYSIGGMLYCVAPLAEVNGDSSVSIPELHFSGLIDWSAS